MTNTPYPKRKSPIENAQAHPRNPKLAIAAYCYHECHGEDADNSHTAKLLVKQCGNESCPLWPHRGWQNITGGNCTSVLGAEA